MLLRFRLLTALNDEPARFHLESRQRAGRDRRDLNVQAERFPQPLRRQRRHGVLVGAAADFDLHGQREQ